MNAEIADYIDVRQRMRDLGCFDPSGIVLLPTNSLQRRHAAN